jgi:hypothetical protein
MIQDDSGNSEGENTLLLKWNGEDTRCNKATFMKTLAMRRCSALSLCTSLVCAAMIWATPRVGAAELYIAEDNIATIATYGVTGTDQGQLRDRSKRTRRNGVVD